MVDWIAIAGNLLLFALVFGMSATVDTVSCRQQVRNVKAILTGAFCQFIILPLLGFLVVKTLDLSSGMGITLLVVTSSPGGSYSNWYECAATCWHDVMMDCYYQHATSSFQNCV
jgi:predicted Na+-dependent transporter